MAEPRERVDWERVAQVTGMSRSEVERRRKLEERVRSTAAKLRENVAAVEKAALLVLEGRGDDEPRAVELAEGAGEVNAQYNEFVGAVRAAARAGPGGMATGAPPPPPRKRVKGKGRK